ncbi:hypothetical protein FHP29_04635 [Nocardioides albidus]|uniref:Uncharacterized protein n=1 Tax=Nocardioides albidus TaxID=1517589 RepID=A0A5C4WAD2_9ACTN|nr:hypothetical protein [Nocardioides albidus]TNM45101.1 hypothetical protein FHP29_04635 [Nocardioides albidus]
MQRDDPDYDDAAWRAIVDNYGERVELEQADEPPDAPSVRDAEDEAYDRAHDGAYDGADERYEERYDGEPVEEDRFVPEPAPPVPVPPADRLLAWLGVFGSPTVLLVCLVLGIGLPTWLGWLLVGGFVGGFCYLVITTPGSPRDPWDDGARV